MVNFFRHLTKLTWLEIKIFLREPMGAIGSVLVPVALFVILGRVTGRPQSRVAIFAGGDLPVFVVMLLAIGAVLSLMTIIAVYREGGILKRLKATPLSPLVILGAQVVAKLVLTSVTLGLLVLAGRKFYSGPPPPAPLSFLLGLLLVVMALLSLGFVLASLIRTARFAQPLGSIILYTLLSFSGLFFPLEKLPESWQLVAQASPLTHGVGLLRALWAGDSWSSQWVAVVVLVVFMVACTTLSRRVFRWE
jgi:ABC-2 type transport system permease protein